MRLDHLAIAAETLEEGTAWAEARLGVTFGPGGQHPRYGTHNRLLGLSDGLYLEVIAIDPGKPSTGPRWFDLDRFSGAPRLVNWICAVDDPARIVINGMERVAMARGDLRWDMGVPRDGTLPARGGFPTLLHWHTDAPPGQSLPPSGCGLDRLVVRHPQAATLRSDLSDALADPRIQFERADRPGLSARFTTPTGAVTL